MCSKLQVVFSFGDLRRKLFRIVGRVHQRGERIVSCSAIGVMVLSRTLADRQCVVRQRCSLQVVCRSGNLGQELPRIVGRVDHCSKIVVRRRPAEY